MIIEIMNVCVWYTYIIIFILIGCVRCGDQDPDPISSPTDADEDNFDLIVKEFESLVTEEDETDDEPDDNITTSEQIQNITDTLYDPNYQQTDYLQVEKQISDGYSYYDQYKPSKEYYYQPSLQYNPQYQYYKYYYQGYVLYRYYQYHFLPEQNRIYYTQLSKWNYKFPIESNQTTESKQQTQEPTEETNETTKPKHSYKNNRPTKRRYRSISKSQPEQQPEPEPTTEDTEPEESTQTSTTPEKSTDTQSTEQSTKHSEPKEDTQHATQPTESTQTTQPRVTHSRVKSRRGYQVPPRFRPRPTTQTTQPTEPTQTTEYKESTSEPKPTTTQTTQHTELEPETIPVELGSDEEDESPQEPKGSGSDDKPADKPEKDEKGGGDGGDKDGDEEDKEPSEVVKICKEIKFFKMNEEGNLVEMVKKRDYEILWIDHNKKKYKLYGKVELILCDDKTIYIHSDGKYFPSSMIHYRLTNAFVLNVYNAFVLVKYYKGKWIKYSRSLLKYVKLYSKDCYGNDVLITKNDYYLDLTEKCCFKYTFKLEVKCSKIIVKDLIAWKKHPKEQFPLSISISRSMKVMLKFSNYMEVYGKKDGNYKLIHSNYL